MQEHVLYNTRGEKIFSALARNIRECAESARRANVNLATVNLKGADLRRAKLPGMDLQEAILSGADLMEADLTGAKLDRASLERTRLRCTILIGASLHSANLRNADAESVTLKDADLSYANMTKADISGSGLRGATLRGCVLPCGTRWETYLSEVVPELLKAGGKTIKEIVASGCWDCHEWENCPMYVALGIKGYGEAPILLRAHVRQFIGLFDNGLIPKPTPEGEQGIAGLS